MSPAKPYSLSDGCNTEEGHADTHNWHPVQMELNLASVLPPGGNTGVFRPVGIVLSFEESGVLLVAPRSTAPAMVPTNTRREFDSIASTAGCFFSSLLK